MRLTILTLQSRLLACATLGVLAALTGCASSNIPEQLENTAKPHIHPVVATHGSDQPLVKGQEYMIMANRPNQIHVVEMTNDSLYKTCQMPGDFGPGALIMSPDNHTAYMLGNHYKDIYGVDLDTCEQVFHARMAWQPNETAISMMSFAISPDGSEIYATQNPTLKYRDHYRVQEPRLAVYKTDAGLNAKPTRTFPVPRQITVMMAADDGSLYMAGADIYKMDVNTGVVETAIPARNWSRPLFSPPDVLNMWPKQTPSKDFTVMYTAAQFQDESYDITTAKFIYGLFNVNLKTGETETTDFTEFTEIYFTGERSPTNRNHLYGVLNRLAKYDIKEKKLLESAELDHTYYVVALNHDGSKVYLGGTFNDLAIHDANSLELISKLELPGGDTSPTTLQAFVR